LHKAATRGHAEAVDLLLQLHQQKRPTSTGAQVGMEDGMVNVRNNFQETPLFKACLHARVDVVRTLVQVRHIIRNLIRDGTWYHVIHHQLTKLGTFSHFIIRVWWCRFGRDTARTPAFVTWRRGALPSKQSTDKDLSTKRSDAYSQYVSLCTPSPSLPCQLSPNPLGLDACTAGVRS
jgi:hypothetical protein